MSKIKIDARIEEETANSIDLLAEDMFRSKRGFSSYVNRVLEDHVKANKKKIEELKRKKKK